MNKEREQEQRNLWPRLKMLCLGVGDQHWMEQLPNLEKLQILSLRKFATEVPTLSQISIKNIAKCRDLRVIDVVFQERDDVEALFDIARSCPLLQKLSVVSHQSNRVEQGLADSLYISLFHALPRLEHFELDLRFRMDGARLQDLARRCPQLTILALLRA